MQASLPRLKLGVAPTLLSLLAVSPLFADSLTPNDWLSRMSAAVASTSYQGTVIRMQGGKAEALKVVHTIHDGVIREKVVAQEGNGLEIIRNGNEVHCILPDKKSELVEEWNDQSTLFSTLPSSEIRFGSEYDASIVREERVAGRQAILLAIRPHDSYRYGHRIWLDTETGFPLRTQLIGDDGSTIEQVLFADISLNGEIKASALVSSYSTENYRFVRQPSRHTIRAVDTAWASTDLPQGFVAVSTHEEKLAGNDDYVTHILYSDGLANVSVFIAPLSGNDPQGPTRVGASNSFSVVATDHHVTAVGEVPRRTVEQIATTMSPR